MSLWGFLFGVVLIDMMGLLIKPYGLAAIVFGLILGMRRESAGILLGAASIVGIAIAVALSFFPEPVAFGPAAPPFFGIAAAIDCALSMAVGKTYFAWILPGRK